MQIVAVVLAAFEGSRRAVDTPLRSTDASSDTGASPLTIEVGCARVMESQSNDICQYVYYLCAWV